MNDPLANIGAPAGAAATPPPQGDPLANIGTPVQAPPAAQPSAAGQFLSDTAEGFKSGLNQTGETAMRVLSATPGVGALLRMTPGWQQSQQQTHDIAHAPADTAGKMTGEALENILEFAGGDEALKGLSTAAKISELANVERALTKSPILTRMLGTAIRGQAVGTAQAALHGATGGQAVTQGAVAGAGGAVAEGVTGAASRLLSRLRPTTTEALGEQLPVLASQKPGATPLAESVANIRDNPQIAAQQQAGAQRGIVNRAQQVAQSALDKLNAARRVRWEEGEGMMNLAPDREALPASRQLGTGQPQLPESTAGAGAAPQLEAGAQTGIEPTGQVGQYEGAFEDQGQPGAQPSGAGGAPPPPGQRVSYVQEAPPHFQPIDVDAETAGIRDFGQAADKIREHAAPVFQTFDNATGGEYTRLRGLRNEAYANEDYNGVRKAESAIDDLFDGTRGKIDRLDYQSAKQAWKTSKVLDAVHDTVSRSFNIPSEESAQEAGVYRGISGGKLMGNLSRLERTYGPTALKDVVGQDGLSGLYRIADLTKSAQYAAQHGQTIGEMGDTLASAASAAKTPATINFARRIILHRLATNPQFAKTVDFIVNNKITPKVYAPLLNSMMGLENQQQNQQDQDQEQ